MQYGQTKESKDLQDGTTITIVEDIYEGSVVRTVKQFTIRVKVMNAQQEMTEFITFTELLRKRREAGTLVNRREDDTLYPMFKIEYPNKDIDGSHIIVKSWTELL